MSGTLYHIKQTTSTQHEARRLIEKGLAGSGDAVVADEQTAGRGRFGRTWISPREGLYATIILPSDPLLSLKAGLALVRVLRRAGVIAGLKWPNDVLVEDLKIAGVLIETTGDLSLVGIGLNLASAPLDTATCVARYVESIDRDEWAQKIVRELIILSEAACDLEAYRAACLTLGQRVRLEGVGADASVEGVASDVDDHGRLVVMATAGERTVSSGECLHLRAADPSS
jgi:BirA family transcriptional regulator, biotin operon repressor / biotin---[acetyl-CoA-carboxylase] ligase